MSKEKYIGILKIGIRGAWPPKAFEVSGLLGAQPLCLQSKLNTISIFNTSLGSDLYRRLQLEPIDSTNYNMDRPIIIQSPKVY